jgi:hypothetical protein
MQFYNNQHKYYSDIDLHARKMYLIGRASDLRCLRKNHASYQRP